MSWGAAIIVLLLVGLAQQRLRRAGAAPLVVYCAHDSLYSEKLLQDFERRTGIRVAARYDTEATKSLGLVELLLQEREHPRCDVFWNNELLGTLELAERGLLLPYQGPGYARIPSAFKDPEGRWTGFAARFRVWILNTEKLTPDVDAIIGALNGDLSRVAIAKPLYGTTRTQYTALWHLWGPDRLKESHRNWRRRGLREVAGNATVKNLVAQGVCDLGLTDTDDFFVAKDEGRPVALLPARLNDGPTIAIPNTVAIIRGTPRLQAAQQLVDYLLSEEGELALARSQSRQVPLGPVDEALLPDEVRELRPWVYQAYPLTELGNASRDCLNWLKSEYLQ